MRYIQIAILVSVFASLPLQAELSAKNIEKMVQDIKAKRSSKLGKDFNASSPFIMLKQELNSTIETIAPAQKTKTAFSLTAIINSSAFIDGKWYKKGDTVGDFKLDSVTADHVALKRENRTITLFFKRAKQIVNISKE